MVIAKQVHLFFVLEFHKIMIQKLTNIKLKKYIKIITLEHNKDN